MQSEMLNYEVSGRMAQYSFDLIRQRRNPLIPTGKSMLSQAALFNDVIAVIRMNTEASLLEASRNSRLFSHPIYDVSSNLFLNCVGAYAEMSAFVKRHGTSEYPEGDLVIRMPERTIRATLKDPDDRKIEIYTESFTKAIYVANSSRYVPSYTARVPFGEPRTHFENAPDVFTFYAAVVGAAACDGVRDWSSKIHQVFMSGNQGKFVV